MAPATSYRLRLGAAPESVAVARDFVRRYAHDRPEQSDVAALLVSELVTNSVVHAASDVEVEVDINDDAFRVCVHDDKGDQLPTLRASGVAADHGRGLVLLTALASGWGFEADQSGKVTWFELAR